MDVRILYSVQSAIMFFIIASPYMYSLTSKLTSKVVKLKLSPYGKVALHAAIYGFIMYVLWLLVAASRNSNYKIESFN